MEINFIHGFSFFNSLGILAFFFGKILKFNLSDKSEQDSRTKKKVQFSHSVSIFYPSYTFSVLASRGQLTKLSSNGYHKCPLNLTLINDVQSGDEARVREHSGT